MAIVSPERLQKPDLSSSMRQHLNGFLTFLSVEKGSSGNTVAAYRNDLQQLAEFIGTIPGSNGWESVDRPAIQDFILDLKQRGYSETSVARKVAATRSFFAFLTGDRDGVRAIDSVRVRSFTVAHFIPHGLWL